MIDIIKHLNAEGYPVKDFIPDSKIHRFEIEPNDRQAGFYIAHRNFLLRTGEEWYHVRYGSWREGKDAARTFTTLKGILTEDDRKNLEKQTTKDTKALEKLIEEGHELVAQEVAAKWEMLSPSGTNPYLEQKQINGDLGIRYDNFNEAIYIPARDHNGKLWTLQKIDRNGKRFYGGGRVSGNFHCIGHFKNKIFIAEGFATAASIHLATSELAVCAFDAGNLRKTANAIKKLYPQAAIVVCGDDDRENPENPGKRSAESAARSIGAALAFPKSESGGTDFNDVHCEKGLQEVAEQLESVNVPATIEQMSAFDIINAPYPDENERTFNRKSTISNVAELLKRLNVTVRYNVISKEEETLIPGRAFSMDNQGNAALAHVTSWCERVRIPTGNLGGYLTAIADANPYNPVATWITSEPWDGTPRIPDLLATIVARGEDQTLKEILIRTWLISAVAAVFEPNGVSAHGVLVLQGPQAMGKTAWFKRLVPHHLEVIADGMSLRPDDKDSVFQVISKWLVELGELDATFRRSDLAQLKAFLTKDKDILRRAYAKKESSYARRTVFFGSVNEVDFLKDPTGNRRFWTIECESINYRHNVDMQQLWAEVYELYRNGDPWILGPDTLALLNTHNEKFEEICSFEEQIREQYVWDSPIRYKLTASQVCLEIGILRPTNQDCKRTAAALRKITGEEPKKNEGIMKFSVPPHKTRPRMS